MKIIIFLFLFNLVNCSENNTQLSSEQGNANTKITYKIPLSKKPIKSSTLEAIQPQVTISTDDFEENKNWNIIIDSLITDSENNILKNSILIISSKDKKILFEQKATESGKIFGRFQVTSEFDSLELSLRVNGITLQSIPIPLQVNIDNSFKSVSKITSIKVPIPVTENSNLTAYVNATNIDEGSFLFLLLIITFVIFGLYIRRKFIAA